MLPKQKVRCMADQTSVSIADVAASVWNANIDDCRGNCSGYVKQVAAKLGVALPDAQANGLVDYLAAASGWSALGNDAKRASLLAAQGYFVIAGLKASGNGHVAVVVPGWAVQNAPLGYWGSLRGDQAAGADQSLTLAWTRADLANVSYFALPPSLVRP
jgi:hypothetical protein